MRKLMMVTIVTAGLFSAGQAMALPACTTAAERDAMVMRALQSQLMVAAVACNQTPAYNSFLTTYQSQFSSAGQQLRGYFNRTYSGSGEKQMNNFITALANAWSRVHMANMKQYCEATWKFMWQATHPVASAATILSSARQVAANPVIGAELCSGAVSPAPVSVQAKKR